MNPEPERARGGLGLSSRRLLSAVKVADYLIMNDMLDVLFSKIAKKLTKSVGTKPHSFTRHPHWNILARLPRNIQISALSRWTDPPQLTKRLEATPAPYRDIVAEAALHPAGDPPGRAVTLYAGDTAEFARAIGVPVVADASSPHGIDRLNVHDVRAFVREDWVVLSSFAGVCNLHVMFLTRDYDGDQPYPTPHWVVLNSCFRFLAPHLRKLTLDIEGYDKYRNAPDGLYTALLDALASSGPALRLEYLRCIFGLEDEVPWAEQGMEVCYPAARALGRAILAAPSLSTLSCSAAACDDVLDFSNVLAAHASSGALKSAELYYVQHISLMSAVANAGASLTTLHIHQSEVAVGPALSALPHLHTLVLYMEYTSRLSTVERGALGELVILDFDGHSEDAVALLSLATQLTALEITVGDFSMGNNNTERVRQCLESMPGLVWGERGRGPRRLRGRRGVRRGSERSGDFWDGLVYDELLA